MTGITFPANQKLDNIEESELDPQAQPNSESDFLHSPFRAKNKTPRDITHPGSTSSSHLNENSHLLDLPLPDLNGVSRGSAPDLLFPHGNSQIYAPESTRHYFSRSSDAINRNFNRDLL